MLLQSWPEELTVCRLSDASDAPAEGLCFLSRTDEEISLVCESRYVPGTCVDREDGWRAFRVAGVLDFSLIGILSRITALLAEEKIGVFVVSTYNTDYVLVRKERFAEALNKLQSAGYGIA